MIGEKVREMAQICGEPSDRHDRLGIQQKSPPCLAGSHLPDWPIFRFLEEPISYPAQQEGESAYRGQKGMILEIKGR
jgi:hypothetical protein